jgi:hypothetical protein
MRGLEGISGHLQAKEEDRQRSRTAGGHRLRSGRFRTVGLGCPWRERFQDLADPGTLRVDSEWRLS